MSPLSASATIVNLLLATGPFTYPQGFVQLGPVTSTVLMLITCYIAYVTALFMIEAVSIAHAIGEQEKDARSDSLFNSGQYKSPIIARKT